jgi:hypothetical protein
MKNPSQSRREQGVPKRHDDLGDRIPNDWLEAVIILSALITMSGGAYFMYHLAQQMP